MASAADVQRWLDQANGPDQRICLLAAEVTIYVEICPIKPLADPTAADALMSAAMDQWYGQVYHPDKPRLHVDVGDQPSGDAAVGSGSPDRQPTPALGPGAAWPRGGHVGPSTNDPEHGKVS